MSDFLNIFLWVVFPYLMLGSFFFGTIIRFTFFRGSVTAVSSEMLEKRKLMVGSILFHIGIIFVFFGHVMGILIPKAFTDFLGIPNETYHLFGSLIMGSSAGIMAIAGMTLLTYRRFHNKRVYVTSSWTDLVVNVALLITMILGMMSTLSGPLNPQFDYRETLAVWVRQLFVFHPDWHLMVNTPIFYKIHTLCGLSIFGFFPYTRLVHALALPWQYIFRRFIVYRRRPRV